MVIFFKHPHFKVEKEFLINRHKICAELSKLHKSKQSLGFNILT